MAAVIALVLDLCLTIYENHPIISRLVEKIIAAGRLGTSLQSHLKTSSPVWMEILVYDEHVYALV